MALGHSEQKVRQQGMEAPGLVVQKLLSDQTELIDLLIAERTRWMRKHGAPGSMRVILRGETCSDSRTLSDGIFTDDVHAHDDKTVCVCVGAFVSCCCSQSQYFYFPAWQILLNAECRSVYELKITFIMKSSPRVFKIGLVISFSLSSDEDTKKKLY